MNWIKIEDELPEEGEVVLFYNGVIGMAFYQIDDCAYERTKKGWNLDLGVILNVEDLPSMFSDREVTHWMPLPKKPKKE